jgi:hypothetical protein
MQRKGVVRGVLRAVEGQSDGRALTPGTYSQLESLWTNAGEWVSPISHHIVYSQSENGGGAPLIMYAANRETVDQPHLSRSQSNNEVGGSQKRAPHASEVAQPTSHRRGSLYQYKPF